jgi:GntR family transcriptional regulator/MocR family aminotransferase
VELLSKIMRELNDGEKIHAGGEQSRLDNGALNSLIPGLTLLYKTVYGEPCTIEVLNEGQLVGRAGYANEDRDTGKWWIEGDRWFRQWDRWAYGEAASFPIRIEGDILSWLDEDGRTVDTALIVPPQL